MRGFGVIKLFHASSEIWNIAGIKQTLIRYIDKGVSSGVEVSEMQKFHAAAAPINRHGTLERRINRDSRGTILTVVAI